MSGTHTLIISTGTVQPKSIHHRAIGSGVWSELCYRKLGVQVAGCLLLETSGALFLAELFPEE